MIKPILIAFFSAIVLVACSTSAQTDKPTVSISSIGEQEFLEARRHFAEYNYVRDTLHVDRSTKQKIERAIRKSYGEFGHLIEVFNIGRINDTGEYIADGYGVTGEIMRRVLTPDLRPVKTRNLRKKYNCFFADTYYAYAKDGVWAGQNWLHEEWNTADVKFMKHDGKEWQLLAEYKDSTWAMDGLVSEEEMFFWGADHYLYIKAIKLGADKRAVLNAENQPEYVFYRLKIE